VVTLVLWLALALGTAGLFLFHFAVPRHQQVEPTASSSARTSTGSPEAPAKTAIPPVPSTTPSVVVAVRPESADRETEASRESARDKKESPPSPDTGERPESQASRVQASAVSPFPVPPETAALSKEGPAGEPSIPLASPRPVRKKIQETTKANGTFYSAQGITEGIIIGRRGTADDRADYYKVRATGAVMLLNLEPPLEGDRRFEIALFDGKRRPVSAGSGKTGPSASLPVTPGGTYYIQVGLSHAPLQTPPYQLTVTFK
jgi:hypothetical protein